MLKADELNEFKEPVRFQNGANITLQTVHDAIINCAMNMNIPVAFAPDKVKSGGLFNSVVDDCLVMYHPTHKNDYYKFCIRVKRQGTYAYVYINSFGQSKQGAKAAIAEQGKADRRGKSLSYQIGSAIGEGLLTMGKNKAKLEEETMYYQCVFDIFDDIIA